MKDSLQLALPRVYSTAIAKIRAGLPSNNTGYGELKSMRLSECPEDKRHAGTEELGDSKWRT